MKRAEKPSKEWERAAAILRPRLSGTVRVCRELGDQYSWHYQPGSQAETEFTSDRWPELEEDESPILTGFWQVHSLIWAALDGIDSLERLLQGWPALYAPYPVVRSVIEMSARAWWMLDPDIGADGRAHRSLALQLMYLRWSHELPMDNADHVAARFEALKDRCERRDVPLRIHPRDGLPSKVADVDPPTDRGGLVSEMLQDNTFGRVLYGHLSSVAHGDPATLLQAIKPEQHPKDGQRGIVALQTSASEVRTLVMSALYGFQPAFERLAAWLGWDTGWWERWMSYTWRKFLRTMAADEAAKGE